MNRAYIYVIITAFLFGSMEVACKVGGADLDALQLTFLRFAIGGLVLLPFALGEMKQRGARLSGRDLLQLVGVGALGIPVSMVLFQLSIMSSNASTVSVLICTSPFFTMLFAHLFTEEKLNRSKLLVLGIALVGILFMLRPWDVQEGNSMLGMGLMLLAAFFFGAYTVAGKTVAARIGLNAQTSFSFLLGSLILLAVILIMGRPVLAGVAQDLPIVLYVGILVTGLGYYCYFKSIALSDAATGSFAFFLKPAIAPVLAALILHETILWNTVVGIGLILAASLLNILLQKRAASRQKIQAHAGRARAKSQACRRAGAGASPLQARDLRQMFAGAPPVAENGFRHYAVLVPLLCAADGIHVLYEVRARDLDRQPGEICFPGGMQEAGETWEECALRETWEEIGLAPDRVELLCELTVIYGVGRFAMHCFLGLVEAGGAGAEADGPGKGGKPSPRDAGGKPADAIGAFLGTLTISPQEVDRVFTVPLKDLLAARPEDYRAQLVQYGPEDFPYRRVTGRDSYDWTRMSSPVPVYDVNGWVIWGLTGRVTKVLVEEIRKRSRQAAGPGPEGGRNAAGFPEAVASAGSCPEGTTDAGGDGEEVPHAAGGGEVATDAMEKGPEDPLR